MLTFDPHKCAADMTAAELMAAHVVMSDSGMSGSFVVARVKAIYAELNREMGQNEQDEQDEVTYERPDSL